MRDLIGTTVGHYRIVEQIGAGGMGVVYRAYDERLDRDVAIKVLPEIVAQDRDRLARFEREAKAVAALSHPNILEIFDFDTEGAVSFAVTELLEGETLQEHLQRSRGPLPWRQVREIGAAVADGLGAAHGKGVVHRDIKPSNIFLCSDGRVKILDFGLAATPGVVASEAETGSLEAPLTRKGSVMGTVGYMAPEQVRGEPADHRSDIFALGCVLYEMLTGVRAFKRETTAEIMTAILREEPPSFAELGAKVPPELANTVSHCLEKKPVQRYQSARDLAFALESMSGSTAPVAPLAAEPVTSSRRWPVIAAILATLSVLLAVLLWMQPPRVDLGSYRFTPFATDAENEYRAAWSPDGRSIAYTKTVDGRAQVVVRGLDADSPVQITDLPGGAWEPFWSPDGGRVWFRSDSGVWSVGRAGGEPELAQEGDVKTAVLSPDGRTLATWRLTITDDGTIGSVWLASPPTAKPRAYTPSPFEVQSKLVPIHLRFSPDGTQILASFVGTEGPEVWLLPFPDGAEAHGRPRQVFSDFQWSSPPDISWMPDSRHVVMAVRETPASRQKLVMADLRAQTLKSLTAGVVDETEPDVAPDGSKIVFTSGGPDYDIVDVPLNGTPLRDMLSTSRDEHSAAWVPGQNRFVYMTDRNGKVEIRVHSSTEDWDRPVVTQENFPEDVTRIVRGPIVSPDGGLVAYDRQPEHGRAAIWISPIVGGPPTRLVETAGSQYAPDWSPDGKWLSLIWVEGGGYKLVKSRVGANNVPQILVDDCLSPAIIPAWSPTGEWIVYHCHEEPGDGIKLVSPDGGQSRFLARVGYPKGFVWSPDGTTIYVIKTRPGNPELLAVDVGTGDVTTIREFSSEVIFSTPFSPGTRFTLAPDARSFSATVFHVRMDLWLLEGFNQRTSLLNRFRQKKVPQP